MFAEVIANGDEITSGRILDTNSQWISIRLEDLGIRVLYHVAVGDDLQAMVAVFRQAIERSDVVVTTGGLGPTADDLTREALANATGRQLVEYPEAVEHIRKFFEARQRPMPERNRVQAVFPSGSLMLRNPRGTAPGIYLSIPREGKSPCHFFSLPGVPVELYEMWPQVEEHLRRVGAGREYIYHRDIKCFGAGESQVEAMLPDLIRRGRDPLVGINASQNTIILRITAVGPDRAACEAKVEPVAKIIYETLGELIFGEGEQELQDVVVAQLREAAKSLAILETETSGLVSDWLAKAQAQKGDVFRGGVVLSDPRAGGFLLQREGAAQALDAGSAPAPEAVATLAAAVRQAFAADIGLAASPLVPLNEDGTLTEFHVALDFGSTPVTRTIRMSSHPRYRQVTVGKHILNTLRLWMRGKI